MAKRQLDLSHTLAPLENELQDMLEEICHLRTEDSALFDASIEHFISKYGGSSYRSLDDLLAASALEAHHLKDHLKEEAIPLDMLLKDLLAK